MNTYLDKKTTLLRRTTGVILCAIFLAACSNEQQPAQTTSPDQQADKQSVIAPSGANVVPTKDYNKLLVMRYMEALSTADFADVEAELLSADYQELRKEFANMDYHAVGSELADIAEPMSIAIANRRNSTDAFIAEENVVVVRYYISGTHSGNFYGIPATGKSIDIAAAAVFWLDDGKITQSWSMADEAGFLRQVGRALPARADGRWEAWPHVLPARTGNEIMEDALANPLNTQEYRNKLQLNAWKAPAYKQQVLHADQSERTGLRSGFFHLLNAGTQPEIENNPFSGAFPNRVDMITNLVADGKRAVVQFRLTANNSNSLFGIPSQNRPVAAYEFGFQEFDGDVWRFNWWFGDDLGMLLQIGGPQDYWFQGDVE